MPVPEGLTPTSRHRVLLQRGAAAGWWVYESENPPGFERDGITYEGLTYSVTFPDHSHLVLLAAEVDGFVLATAWQYGDDQIQEIAYRPGL